jgi:hypothetical protein
MAARTIGRREDKMRRLVAQLPLFLLVLLLASSAKAQSNIPDGVFVRESNGTTWMVLKGQRVGVPVWQVGDADIQAIPASDQWAVLSVNDTGAMVAGSKPAWLDAQQAAQAVSPSPAAPTAVPVAATAPPTTNDVAELSYVRITADKKGFRAVATVTNRSGAPLAGMRLRYDAVDGGDVVLGSVTETLPTLASGAIFYDSVNGQARSADAQISAVRLTIENPGKVPTANDKPVHPFSVADVKLARYESTYDRNRNAYRVTATISNGGPDIGRFSTSIAYVLFDDAGKVVGTGHSGWIDGAPDTIPTGMSLRVDSGAIDVDATPTRAEVQPYRE